MSRQEYTVYEVLRVMDGKILFLHEHLLRLQKSLEHYGGMRISCDELISEIESVAEKRSKDQGKKDPKNFNIRIKINSDAARIVETFEGEYPGEAEIKNGVPLATYKFKRENPNVKSLDAKQREEIVRIRENVGAFQMLYIHDNNIYECERANIFFIKDDKIITPPDASVLLGVTRAKVLEVAEESGIQVDKRFVSMTELPEMNAAAISGTSLNILPVSRIDEIPFDVNNRILRTLISGFAEKL